MSQLIGGPWPDGLELRAFAHDGVTLRRASEHDVDRFVDITERVLGPHAYATYDIVPDVLRAGVRADFHPEVTATLHRDGEALGFVVVERQPERAWLDLMVVDEPFLGRGIGTALLGWLQEWSSAAEAELALSVLERNPARRLYERLGFTVEREEPPRISMRWAPTPGD